MSIPYTRVFKAYIKVSVARSSLSIVFTSQVVSVVYTRVSVACPSLSIAFT